MRVSKAIPFVFVLGAVAVNGCGGGGSAAATTNTDNSYTVGPFTTRVAGPQQLQQIVGSSGGAVVTGLAGGSFTILQLTGQTDLNRTRIAYDIGSQVYTSHIDGTAQRKVTTDSGYSSSTTPVITSLGQVVFVRADTGGHPHIAICYLDGTGERALTSGIFDDTNPAVSPDGTKILFARTGDSSGHVQIYQINSDGTGLLGRSSGQFEENFPSFGPDNTRFVFTRVVTVNAVAVRRPYLNSGGTAAVPYSSNSQSLDLVSSRWAPNGLSLISTYYNSNLGVLQMVAVPPNNGTIYSLPSPANTSDDVVNWSPDSRFITWRRLGVGANSEDQVFVANSDGHNPQPITAQGDTATGPSWSPYPNWPYIGTRGLLGTAAAGFLFGQTTDGVQSVLTFDAATRSTAKAVKDPNVPNGSDAVVFDLTADHIASIRYMNTLWGGPITVPVGGNAPSALVSFNSATGQVEAVLVASTKRASPGAKKLGSSLTFEGPFEGVFNGKGKNLAPNGAASVTLAKGGSVASVRASL